MSGFANPILGGGGALVYPSVHSPNFDIANPAASPAQSWALLKNGLAYLFGVVLTGGTITGPDYVINTTGAFFYTGTPALGNLAASVVPGSVNVTDPEGNTALPGITVYGQAGNTSFVEMLAGSPAVLNIGTGDSAEAVPGLVRGIVQGSGATRTIIHDMRAARMTGENATAQAELQLISPSADLTTTPPTISLVAQDGVNANAVTVTPSKTLIASLLTAITTALTVGAGAAVTGGTVTDTLQVTGTTELDGTVTLKNGAASSTITTAADGHPRFSATVELAEVATPSTPSSGVKLWADVNGKLNFKGVNGTAELAQAITVDGAVTATGGTTGAPSLITTDTFHAVTLTTPANWTVNNTLEVRLEADGTVTIDGELTAAAAIATGAALATLPAAYRPANRSVRMTANVNTGTASVGAVLLNLTTAGVLSTFPAISSGQTLNISGRYLLGA